ncbi:MAG: pseudouridine synthase, partial [Miltoncostaeaceae bacterium]
MTEGSVVRFTVPAGEPARRLDAVLAAHESVESRAEAQRLIEAGRVTVNGEERVKRHRVSPGDLVEARLPAEPSGPALRPEDLGVPVVHADDYLLVVDKPAGMVTHPSRGHSTGTLVHGLLSGGIAGGEDPQRPGIVHRLDKETSGLLVIAKSDAAHHGLADQFAAHTAERA